MGNIRAGMVFVQQEHIVHSDLTSANVLLGGGGGVKVRVAVVDHCSSAGVARLHAVYAADGVVLASGKLPRFLFFRFARAVSVGKSELSVGVWYASSTLRGCTNTGVLHRQRF